MERNSWILRALWSAHLTSCIIQPREFPLGLSFQAQHSAAGWHRGFLCAYPEPSQGLAQGSCSITSPSVGCKTLAVGDSSLFWPIVPPACRKYWLFRMLPACLQRLCFFRPWLRENEGSESVPRQLGVLPTSFLLFLPFEDLASPISVGAMDPGELSGQLQMLSSGWRRRHLCSLAKPVLSPSKFLTGELPPQGS